MEAGQIVLYNSRTKVYVIKHTGNGWLGEVLGDSTEGWSRFRADSHLENYISQYTDTYLWLTGLEQPVLHPELNYQIF